MTRFTLASFFIFLLFAISACTKHKGDFLEVIPTATITFSSPVAGSTFNNGDSVNIKAVAVSTDVLHGYDVSVHKAGDTTSYFFVHVHDHNATLNIDQKWKNTFTTTNNMEAEVTLYLDHAGHTKKGRVAFKVQ